MELNFTKMHGLGNCFILMDDRDNQIGHVVDLAALSRAICDRDFGIGADGLILVQSSKHCDLRMRIINEDGSEAEMCGNGIRCFSRFTADRKMTSKTVLAVETLAGVIETRLNADGDVRVDLGEPQFHSKDINIKSGELITVREQDRDFTFVSMGNPHAVTFVNNFNFPWRDMGCAVENSPTFPNKTNVEFVEILSRDEIRMKVWERGCGETKACGTGASAAVVAGIAKELLVREPIIVHLPGGQLLIEWNSNGHVLMTGPATYVCEGKYFSAL